VTDVLRGRELDAAVLLGVPLAEGQPLCGRCGLPLHREEVPAWWAVAGDESYFFCECGGFWALSLKRGVWWDVAAAFGE
jgi:hypothetical protein